MLYSKSKIEIEEILKLKPCFCSPFVWAKQWMSVYRDFAWEAFREARQKLLVEEKENFKCLEKKIPQRTFFWSSRGTWKPEKRLEIKREPENVEKSVFFSPRLSLYHWRQIQYNVGCENLVQALGWPRGLFCLSRVANISSCLQNQKSKNA